MKTLVRMLLIVGCLLPAGLSSSYAQEDWEVAFYDANTRAVVIIRPGAVQTLAAPACFTPSTNPGDYRNWLRRNVALSADNRFLVAGMTDDFPGVVVADLQRETCFEVRVEGDYLGRGDYALTSNHTRRANYDVDVAVFSPDGSQMAFGYVTYGPVGKILVVDLVEAPGAVLLTRRWEGNPLLEYWRADGIYFFDVGCYGCETGATGVLQRWNPASDEVAIVPEAFTRAHGDTLSLTGETLVTIYHDEYPVPPAMDARNVIEYTGENGANAVVYYAPEVSGLGPATWVLDGKAFFIRGTLVWRDGSITPVEAGGCSGIIAGTPDGWLAQDEAYAIHHCRVVDGAVVSSRVEAAISGRVVLLRQSPLGAAAADPVTPLAFADVFRLSFCGIQAEAPRLGLGAHRGHVIAGEALPFYSEPDADSAVVGTFTAFQVVNGPFCSDAKTIWWLIAVGEQQGWTPERRDNEQLLELDCTRETPSQFEVGSQVVYGVPVVSRLPLGELEPGQAVTVLDGPLCDGDFYWWLVDSQGVVGWVLES